MHEMVGKKPRTREWRGLSLHQGCDFAFLQPR
jgi:hypothetical protein